MKSIVESKFYSILTTISNLIIVNLLFIIGSLPVITAGVSMRALYATIIKMELGESNIKQVFCSEYFKKFGTVLLSSVIFVLTTIVLLFDFVIITQFWNSASADLCVGLVISAGTATLLTAEYYFPLIAAYNLKVLAAIKSSLILSMRYLPRSILISVINLLPMSLVYFGTYIFRVILPIWLCIGFAISAYINVRLLKPAFADVESRKNVPGDRNEQV